MKNTSRLVRGLRFSLYGLGLLLALGLLGYQARYHLFPCSVYSRLDILRQGSLSSKRLAYLAPDRMVTLAADGLKIAGEIYVPAAGEGSHPAILMLHGSSRWGRKIAICRLLARKLSQRGYEVLAFDFRGFGDSDDPPAPDSALAWKMEDDIRAGVDFLAGLPAVDPARIYVLGHSMGGAYGMYGGSMDDRVAKIVAIGPTRRWKERLAGEKDSFLNRFCRMRGLKHVLPMPVYTAVEEPLMPESTLVYFQAQQHKPILLLDGELESTEDRAFLQELYGRMASPKSYRTLPGTGHYLGIVGFELFQSVPVLSHLALYDAGIVDRAVRVIDRFLAEQLPEGEDDLMVKVSN